MRDGATLHTFMWSFQTIKEHMERSPKLATLHPDQQRVRPSRTTASSGKGNWYSTGIHLPADQYDDCNYILGSGRVRQMCDIAHQYGVRVIVDAVANHFTSDWDVIDPSWQNEDYFHPSTGRSGITTTARIARRASFRGLWDLNTQNSRWPTAWQSSTKVVADGADGFRYDAAKHHRARNEVGSSRYWNTILPNGAQYQYGRGRWDKNVREADYANIFPLILRRRAASPAQTTVRRCATR